MWGRGLCCVKATQERSVRQMIILPRLCPAPAAAGGVEADGHFRPLAGQLYEGLDGAEVPGRHPQVAVRAVLRAGGGRACAGRGLVGPREGGNFMPAAAPPDSVAEGSRACGQGAAAGVASPPTTEARWKWLANPLPEPGTHMCPLSDAALRAKQAEQTTTVVETVVVKNKEHARAPSPAPGVPCLVEVHDAQRGQAAEDALHI